MSDLLSGNGRSSRSVIDGPKLILKLWLDQICIFGEIFTFWPESAYSTLTPSFRDFWFLALFPSSYIGHWPNIIMPKGTLLAMKNLV